MNSKINLFINIFKNRFSIIFTGRLTETTHAGRFIEIPHSDTRFIIALFTKNTGERKDYSISTKLKFYVKLNPNKCVIK